MPLNLVASVAQCLRSHPNQRFKARDLADWLMVTYPSACADKIAKSAAIHNETQLLQQLVAEIGANRHRLVKRYPEVKTTESRPRLYYWNPSTDEEQIAVAEIGNTATSEDSKVEPAREHDLYPLLAIFLRSEFGIYSKRIDEKTASNSHGPKGNQWLFPDLVAMEDLTAELEPEVREWASEVSARKVRLWSFEVKLVLNKSNVRESFFQAVSNSSWANFGYLSAPDIQGGDTMRELRLLCALHGIGLLRLDSENPAESEILIPAREKSEIDWGNANRLAAENRDFMQVVKLVRQFHQTGDPRERDWDKVPT